MKQHYKLHRTESGANPKSGVRTFGVWTQRRSDEERSRRLSDGLAGQIRMMMMMVIVMVIGTLSTENKFSGKSFKHSFFFHLKIGSYLRDCNKKNKRRKTENQSLSMKVKWSKMRIKHLFYCREAHALPII
jgi:hypothetical protein